MGKSCSVLEKFIFLHFKPFHHSINFKSYDVMMSVSIQGRVYCLIEVLYHKSGFDLTTRDSYITILIKIFTNHILAKSAYFTNRIEWTEQDYGLKTGKQVPNYSTLRWFQKHSYRRYPAIIYFFEGHPHSSYAQGGRELQGCVRTQKIFFLDHKRSY